jgi:hypothetical protein
MPSGGYEFGGISWIVCEDVSRERGIIGIIGGMYGVWQNSVSFVSQLWMSSAFRPSVQVATMIVPVPKDAFNVGTCVQVCH